MAEVCVQTVYVTDVRAAVDFYATALGCEVQAWYDDCLVQLKSSGTTLIIQQVEAGQAPCTVLAFQVDDLEQAMQSVVAAGGSLLTETPQPCPVGRYARFRTQQGALHELLEFSSAA